MSFENTKLAISGGLAKPPFFEAIYELAGTDQPNIAFDMSPSVTQADYDAARTMFTAGLKRLGLPEPIWLQNSAADTLTKDSLESGLENADVFFVNGGATKLCFEKWQAADLTDDIVERVSSGSIVGAGGSAGAMIWFAQGYSDSMMYDVPGGNDWDYVIAQGAGLFNSWVTAHHTDIDNQGRDRQRGFVETLERNRGMWQRAIGLDTGASLICANGIATVKDVSVPERPADHDVYIYDEAIEQPRVLRHGDTISLKQL